MFVLFGGGQAGKQAGRWTGAGGYTANALCPLICSLKFDRSCHGLHWTIRGRSFIYFNFRFTLMKYSNRRLCRLYPTEFEAVSTRNNIAACNILGDRLSAIYSLVHQSLPASSELLLLRWAAGSGRSFWIRNEIAEGAFYPA